MKIFTRIENGVFVAEFTGKLDTSTSGDAYDKMVNIAKECGSKLVLNLEKLEYMSRASYGRKWCLASGSSGDQIDVSYLDTIFELYSGYHFGQVIEAA